MNYNSDVNGYEALGLINYQYNNTLAGKMVALTFELVMEERTNISSVRFVGRGQRP